MRLATRARWRGYNISQASKFYGERKPGGQHSQLQFSLEEPDPLGSGDSGVMPEMTVAVDTEQITDSARSASCSPPPLSES